MRTGHHAIVTPTAPTLALLSKTDGAAVLFFKDGFHYLGAAIRLQGSMQHVHQEALHLNSQTSSTLGTHQRSCLTTSSTSVTHWALLSLPTAISVLGDQTGQCVSGALTYGLQVALRFSMEEELLSQVHHCRNQHTLWREKKNNFLDLLSDAPCGNTPGNENDLLGDCILDDAIVVKGGGNINNGSVCTGAFLGAGDAAIHENRSEVVDLLACHVWDHATAPGKRVDIEDKDFLTDWPCDGVLSTCH